MSIKIEKFMPVDDNNTKQFNLTVLQRMDPHIEDILNTSTRVNMYKFNADHNHWNRKDVEGPLFVVKRNTPPRFQFVVLNRKNTGNMIENLLGDFQYDVQTPYLLYRSSSKEFNGIWFYHSEQCYDAACVFNRILSAYSKVPPIINIFSSKREEVHTTTSIGGSLEPSLAHPSSADVSEDSPSANFFNTVVSIGQNIGNTHGVSGSSSGSSSDSDSGSEPPYHVSAPPLPSNKAVLMPFPSSANQVTSLPIMSSTSLMPFIENQGLINSNRIVNLVKPSSFIAQAFHHVPNLNQSHGTALLQPFPPPKLPLSFTSGSSSTSSNHTDISRDTLRDALLILVQDNQFIDMFYQALLKVHHQP